MSRSWICRAITAAALLAMPLCADVTLRYKTELKLNPSLPPQMTGQMAKGIESSIPPETTLQLKEGKGYSVAGPFRSICDFTSKEITLLDSEHQHFAKTSIDGMAEEMAKAFDNIPPEGRAAMAAMKVTAESKMTGRTATIMGVEVEERELVMSMAGPPMPNVPPGPMMKMVMQFWTAKAGEAMRVPAIREVTGYNLWAYATMNPLSAMEKMFKQMPGMADGLTQIIKDMQAAKTAVLRTHTAMYLPGLAAMMKQMPAGQNPFGTTFDADTAMMEVNQELAEMSTAPLPDQLFQVPEGYKSAPAGDIVKDMMSKYMPAAAKK
jgi:hypothetical protein